MDTERLIKKKLRAKKDGNILQFAEATNSLADLYFQLGRLDDAREEYTEQVEACRILNDKLSLAVAHRMIGEIHLSLEDYQQALKHQKLYLEGAQEMKNELEEQRAFATLGRTYFCLAERFPEKSDEQIDALTNAKKAYAKSMFLCDKLQGIPKAEMATIRARLLLNWGLVLDAQMKPHEAINLYNKCRLICSTYNLKEDEHRAYLALGSHHERQHDKEKALKYLEMAAETENVSMKANALLAKAELLLKYGNWLNARKDLVVLFSIKDLPQSTREQVEKLLRIAVTLSRTENMVNSDIGNIKIQKNRFQLYEKLGDAAAAVQCYEKALEYYKEMLAQAEKEKSFDGITAGLISLAQTLKDLGRYEEAYTYAQRELSMCSDPREACRSALFSADLLESTGATSSDICRAYELALSKATLTSIPSLEITVLKAYLHYSETQTLKDTEEMRDRLNQLLDTVPEFDSEKENSENLDIGADVDLDKLSDLDIPNCEENSSSMRLKSTRSSRTGLVIKKNERGETQLHIACINCNIERVQKLIDDGHPTDIRDNFGWTPLHEAANHGHVEIAKLLLNAGADVNDPGGSSCEGITPLHDAASCGNFSVMNLLIEFGANIYAVTEKGDTILDSLEDWRKRAKELSGLDKSEYEHMHSKLSQKGVTRTTVKKRMNITLERKSSHCIDVLKEEENENTERHNVSAGEVYKQTIDNLRNRGTRLGPFIKSATSHKDLAPLLDSDQVLLDEWLDDDIGPNSSKKKNNRTDLLFTAKRKSAGSAPVERKSKRQRTEVNSKILSSTLQDSETEESCDSNSAEICEVIEEPDEVRSLKKQTTLLSLSFSRHSVSCTQSPSAYVVSRSGSQQVQAKEMNVEVLIEKKLFKLRLCVSNENKITTESIIRQVQKKFKEETGCTPDFNLITSNGDSTISQSTINSCYLNCKPLSLIGNIRKMDIPPISDRYKTICSSCNIGGLFSAIDEGTVKCLRTCENTSTFRLRGRETLNSDVFPLLKSLQYQMHLQVLNISGVELNDFGEILSSSLEQLTLLQELHLRCCDIDLNCLSQFRQFPLQTRVLDLSYNPLGKRASHQLHTLLSCLKNLQTLNMSNCEVENIFAGTSNAALNNLDFAQNPIMGEGLRSLLQPHILSLNLSGSIQDGKSRIIKELFSHPRFSLATLESLDLSMCDLCDDDLSRILSQTANLAKLVINGNIKLSKKSLCDVLQHKPTLSYIDFSGCSEITDPPDLEVFICHPEICTLVVSMASEVQQSWLKLWGGQGYIQTLPHNVVIFNHY
ncbi:tonsoku-like protein isoform X1 [Neodiprion virginianus]|uniref:tonsoku-like protein isoform X1 n=2 Tax=Neodiprion virginianus TaxID=2961670 RepID=UPI001EE6C31C|nr:tonsoku-like protein isoform X1 [Neodiprion virginianus]